MWDLGCKSSCLGASEDPGAQRGRFPRRRHRLQGIADLKKSYSVEDESDLTLLGYIAFLDPPKESAGAAIAALIKSGVAVKVISGDNEIVTRKICREVGLEVDRIALGPDIEPMSEGALAELAEKTAVFAKVSPAQKARVIGALHSDGHVVGFLGDGINDSPAHCFRPVGSSNPC